MLLTSDWSRYKSQHNYCSIWYSLGHLGVASYQIWKPFPIFESISEMSHLKHWLETSETFRISNIQTYYTASFDTQKSSFWNPKPLSDVSFGYLKDFSDMLWRLALGLYKWPLGAKHVLDLMSKVRRLRWHLRRLTWYLRRVRWHLRRVI